MRFHALSRPAQALVLLLAFAGALGISTALAQFPPPSTFFGSVTDSGGVVPEGLPVEAYVGDKLCGKGFTQFTGDGDAKVTVYFAHVVSREQTTGCGTDGVDVRIKIGDRFAPQTGQWKAGPVQVNVTFGTATAAPIPTFTPAPTSRPASGTAEPGTGGSESPVGTIRPGSPGAGSPVITLAGGLTSSMPGPGRPEGEDDGGFPIWAAIVVGLGGIAVVGGGVGYVMSRSNREEEGDGGWSGGPGPQ